MYEKDADKSRRHHSYAQLKTEHLSGASFVKMIYNFFINEGKDATLTLGKMLSGQITEDTDQEKDGETAETIEKESELAQGTTTTAQSQNSATDTLTTAPEQMIIPAPEETPEEPERSIFPLDKLGRVFGVINDEIEFGLISKSSIGIEDLKTQVKEKLPDFVDKILIYEIGETYPYYAVKYFVKDQYDIYDFFTDLIVSKPEIKEVIIYSSSDAELPYAYLDKITDTGNDALIL